MGRRPSILERDSPSGLTFPVARVQEPLKSTKKRELGLLTSIGFAFDKRRWVLTLLYYI